MSIHIKEKKRILYKKTSPGRHFASQTSTASASSKSLICFPGSLGGPQVPSFLGPEQVERRMEGENGTSPGYRMTEGPPLEGS